MIINKRAIRQEESHANIMCAHMHLMPKQACIEEL